MGKFTATESNTATGDCSFNRDVEQKNIHEGIMGGDQQQLTEQQRMDISSIAREISRQSEEQGQCGPGPVNIKQVRSFGAERLATELYSHRKFKALLKTCLSIIGRQLSKIKKISIFGISITFRKNKGRELL